MEGKEKIIVALDVPTLDEAKRLTEELVDHVGMFKVGLQLITAEGGPRVVKAISELGGKVMYDGKFHDIPNTVKGASAALPDGVEMFTIHASGGLKMIRAAMSDAEAGVLVVTVLTSLSEEHAHLIYGVPSKAKVIEFAIWADLAEVDGMVCSPQELTILREEEFNESLLLVTPGIRPTWAVKGDQKRITTPAEAIKMGADYLVIGRPITQPPKEIGSPVEAAKRIAEEIAEAMEDIE